MRQVREIWEIVKKISWFWLFDSYSVLIVAWFVHFQFQEIQSDLKITENVSHHEMLIDKSKALKTKKTPLLQQNFFLLIESE